MRNFSFPSNMSLIIPCYPHQCEVVVLGLPLMEEKHHEKKEIEDRAAASPYLSK